MSDFALINNPDFYVYENIKAYDSFVTCAKEYDEEIDNIINMIDFAKEANISGDIKDKSNGNTTIFRDLLDSMDKTLIYRPIAPDAIVKIFTQLKVTINESTYSL